IERPVWKNRACWASSYAMYPWRAAKASASASSTPPAILAHLRSRFFIASPPLREGRHRRATSGYSVGGIGVGVPAAGRGPPQDRLRRPQRRHEYGGDAAARPRPVAGEEQVFDRAGDVRPAGAELVRGHLPAE